MPGPINPIGYIVLTRSPDGSLAIVDWDGEIHPTRVGADVAIEDARRTLGDAHVILGVIYPLVDDLSIQGVTRSDLTKTELDSLARAVDDVLSRWAGFPHMTGPLTSAWEKIEAAFGGSGAD